MKKLPLYLSILSLVGVVALFLLVLFFSPVRKAGSEPDSKNESASSDLKVAFLQTDSVLVNYQLAIDLHADFMSKQQQYNTEFNAKRSDLEQKAIAFQEKVQRGGFLTEERAVRERDRLLAQEEEMKQLDYELSAKLAEMEAAINKQLTDSIVAYVREYNRKHGYTYIFSNNGNIIIGAPQCNISKAVLDGLNARYAASKK
ncbi:MAG TPA: OmpH family outer membrane protein [Prolixibacteraceae bacterium]|nr:OmpH family outer membrane protein [Prolixibacteraceae bacterium]